MVCAHSRVEEDVAKVKASMSRAGATAAAMAGAAEVAPEGIAVHAVDAASSPNSNMSAIAANLADSSATTAHLAGSEVTDAEVARAEAEVVRSEDAAESTAKQPSDEQHTARRANEAGNDRSGDTEGKDRDVEDDEEEDDEEDEEEDAEAADAADAAATEQDPQDSLEKLHESETGSKTIGESSVGAAGAEAQRLQKASDLEAAA